MYLITSKDFEPFISDYFSLENCYVEGMTVFNLRDKTYTKDGVNWIDIPQDHL